jgi:hypothetical protein
MIYVNADRGIDGWDKPSFGRGGRVVFASVGPTTAPSREEELQLEIFYSMHFSWISTRARRGGAGGARGGKRKNAIMLPRYKLSLNNIWHDKEHLLEGMLPSIAKPASMDDLE